MNDPLIWLTLAACLGSCFFATCNLSLKWFSRSQLLDLLQDRGHAHRLADLQDRLPGLHLLTATFRTTLNLTVLLCVLLYLENRYRIYTSVAVPMPRAMYLAGFILAGALVSVFGVAIPSSMAHYHPEAVLARSWGVLSLCATIFMPMVRALHLFDPLVRRLTGVQVDHERAAAQLTDEVLSVVEEHQESGRVDSQQKQMIEAVFEFRSTTAGQIMTPRTDMVGIELESSLAQIRALILETGFSRYPLYRQSLDDIAGMLYAKDLIHYVGSDNSLPPFDVRQVLREALIVPENKPVQQLLAEFKSRKVHVAIVVDEYGGTAGLVSIEDILEELVGEIQDEYEPTEQGPEIHRLDAHTVEVDARLHVDDVNRALDLHLPEDEDYDTLGGLIFSTLGRIPDTGETVELDNVRLIVVEAGRTKINRIRLEILEAYQDHQPTQDAAPPDQETNSPPRSNQ
ncbi:MAG: HlyC/CorC family transporter [Phycisphaeraceae bacterium]|nr:HlyC/CorC family transporter [Phycisphaeraceae bacterium]